jgi:hypothetical protein
LFAYLFSRTFSTSYQYFSLIINQPTTMTFQTTTGYGIELWEGGCGEGKKRTTEGSDPNDNILYHYMAAQI